MSSSLLLFTVLIQLIVLLFNSSFFIKSSANYVKHTSNQITHHRSIPEQSSSSLLISPDLHQLPITVTKLGAYDYFTDESSPLIFNGALLMFESIVEASPQWAGNWDPRFLNCSCYYRMRDLYSGIVIVNITETCNHAFGAAFAMTNGEGLDTVFIFGTPWMRYNSKENDESKVDSDWPPWSGPCKENNCTIDASWSSDPKLQSWNMSIPAARPITLVYNNDVTHIAPPSSVQAKKRMINSSLPPHQWIMAIEAGSRTHFGISNSSDPTDPDGWTFLDPSVYILPTFGFPDVGQCPSIRYDPEAGYYYVLTGGQTVRVMRSSDLKNWTLANNRGAILPPTQGDCIVAPSMYSNFKPSGDALAHLQKCQNSNSSTGFGNDSDVDLTEVIINGTLVTLLQYGSGDQATFGFANLAMYNGSMFDLLDGMFM